MYYVASVWSQGFFMHVVAVCCSRRFVAAVSNATRPVGCLHGSRKTRSCQGFGGLTEDSRKRLMNRHRPDSDLDSSTLGALTGALEEAPKLGEKQPATCG